MQVSNNDSNQEMVNIQTFRRKLQIAAQSHDPNSMAEVVVVTFTPKEIKGTKAQKHQQDSLVVDGSEYGGLLTALLDAHSAAEAVSTP